MILLDDRVGSRELLRFFTPFDIPVDTTRLEFGDACWPGRGPNGDCLIGMERKRISDFVNSMRERRLSGHQLQGLADTYEFTYLVVEGFFRPGDRGELEERRGQGWRSMGVSYREMDNHLSTLELRCGVIVRRTCTPQETAALVVDLYKWWNEKDWGKHKSHLAMYAPSPDALITTRKLGFVSPETQIRRKYGEAGVVAWKMAGQLPGLDTKAELVVAHFRTADAMVRAKAKDWTEIKGIGKTLADRFVGLLRGKA